MKREKVTLFGCGGWGSRIAEKLAARGDVDLIVIDEIRECAITLGLRLGVEWSNNPFEYLSVSGTQLDNDIGGSVIIATPPHERIALIDAVLNGYGRAPKRLRIEKPLASLPSEAEYIAKACESRGVVLSVGFTLLHHFLYQQAFNYIKRENVSARLVKGTRIGRRARHRADALVDLGSHTASIGAYLNAECCIRAEYSEECEERFTEIVLSDNSVIRVDELRNECVLPHDFYVITVDNHDALSEDLDAWLLDAHRGTAIVGIEATEMVYRELKRLAVLS